MATERQKKQPEGTIPLPDIGELQRRASVNTNVEPVNLPQVSFVQNETGNINNVKLMAPVTKKRSVYVAKHNIGIYTDLQSPEEIEYAVDIQLAKKFRDNYFSLTDMGIKRSSVVGDAINSFTKGIGSAVMTTTQLLERQLTAISDSVSDLPQNLEKWQLDLNEENISIDPETRKRVLDNYEKASAFRRQKLQSMVDRHKQSLLAAGLGRDASDGILFDIGSGLTSMFGALGLSIVTKSPSSASVLFGWIAGRSSYEELVEEGMSPSRAASLGAISGIAEGALEYIGLDYFIRAMKLKGVAARVIGAIEEPLQEGAQAMAEEIIMQTFGNRRKEADEIINDIFYQALIGAIIGAPVSVIARAGQVSLEKKGIEPDRAKETAAWITEKATSQAAMEEVEKVINNEDNPLTFPENDVKKGMESFVNIAREEISNMTPEKRRYINDMREQIKKDALSEGLSNEESEFAAQTMASLATLWNNAAGVSPQEWYNSHKLEIINEARAKQNEQENFEDDENPPDIYFQPTSNAGAEQGQDAAAIKEWQEKGTDSKYFKKWFGDSKVVDENGKPKLINGFYVKASHQIAQMKPTYMEIYNLGLKIWPVMTKIGKTKFWENIVYGVDMEGVSKHDVELLNELSDINKTKYNDDVHNLFFRSATRAYPEIPKYVFARRIGKVPVEQRSHNFRDNTQENGVSVLGLYGIGSEQVDTGAESFRMFNSGKEIIIGGWATDWNRGSDGEYLLNGIDFEAKKESDLKSVNNQGTFDGNNPNIYYQSAKYNSERARLEQEKKRLSERIEEYKSGKIKKRYIDVGKTNEILKYAGIPDHDLKIRKTTIDKSTKTKHEVDIETFKELPDLLADPVLILRSDTVEGSFVVLLNKTGDKNNSPLIAIIDPNGEMRINFIDSVYGKDNKYWFQNQIDKGNLIYINEKEAFNPLNARLYLRGKTDINASYGNSLLTKEKFVNTYYQNENLQGPRAQTTFETERAVMRLFKSHDKSSIVHELGHIFLRNIDELSRISTDERFIVLKKKVDNYLKVEFDESGKALYDKEYASDSGETSLNPHEKFANAFTAYVSTGRAPNSAMKRIFELFRNWLQQIKDVLVESEATALEASPEMVEALNELLVPMEFERTSYTSEERQAIEQQIEDIREGKDIEISGQKLAEIRNYINQVNQRRPKAPKDDLLYYIKRLGVKESFPLLDKARDAGVKVLTPKSPHYRQALGEDNLQSFLAGLEFLQTARDNELESIGSEDLQTQSLELIERALDGERIDSADNLARIEEIEDYDRNIDAINELFGGNLSEAETVLDMIDELADRNFAVVSYDTLENLQELARRVEKQNKALGKGAKIENIEASVIRDKTMIKNKKEMIQKKEKDLKKKAAELAKKEKAADKKINIKAEKKKIEKARKEIQDGKQHIKETIEKMKATEKSLADERKLYGDIKAALDAIVAKNKDIGKKINKKNINDAIAENNRAKLLDAVNDALIEIEQMLEGTPDYIDSQKKYVNPSILIAEKKKALLETAKQRIADKKDATGYRMALRTALSGIPHFSNVKVESPVDRKSKLMVAKEYVLDDWTKIKSWQELVDNLDAIFRQVESKSRAKYQEVMKEAIKKEINKNIWVKKGRNKIGRYSDQINDFFKELQEIWEADPKELAARLIASNSALDDIANIESDNAYYKITNTEIIKNRLMTWLLMTPGQRDTKGNILSQELYEMLVDVRKQANKGFDLEQQNARANFKDLRDSLTEEIKSGRMSKGVNKLTKIFTSVEGNWESIINLMFGKKHIEELSILKEQSEADTHIETDLQNFLHKAAKLFGGEKKYRQAYNEMVNKKSKWMDYKLNVEKPGKPEEIELNKAQILTFYIWSKNFDLMKRLLIQFEEPMYDNHGKRIAPPAKNIIAMFNELTPKEKKLGDLIQITAQQYYDSMNEVKRRLTGLELNEQENYFPSVAKQMLSDVDIIQSRMSQIVAPGAIKERSKSDMVRQMPSDPLQILQRHIRIANKYIFEQEKKIKLRKILQDPVLQNAIETAKDIKGNIYFGEDIYIAAKNTIDRISLPKYVERMTTTDSFISKIVGNIVKTYIAIKPTIAFKQLIAFVNYSEGIPKDDYLKYIAEFWKNPKAAIKFMAANDFVRARYSQGLANETIQRLTKTDLLTGTNKFNKLLTLNIRLGDAASVVMGGYARVRYHIEKGMSRKEAFDEFELATLRTQQSGQSSALAKWQDNNGNAGLLFSAFRNAQGQYARKIADAYIQMRRGEITPARAAEIFMIYSVYNGVFYTLLSLGIADFFDDDDDNKDLASIIVSPVSTIVGALPLLDDAVNVLGQYIIDGKVSFNAKRGDVIGISDFTDWYNSVLGTWFNEKKDLNLDFWINFADFPVRAGLGLPLKTFVNQLAGIKEAVTGEDVAKGFLRALGYTEYRAGKMLGQNN